MLNQYDHHITHSSGRLLAHVWKGTPETSPYYAAVWRLKPDTTRGQFVKNLPGKTTAQDATAAAIDFMNNWVAAYLIKHPPKGARK